MLAARRLALATLAEALPGPAGRTPVMLQQALAAQHSLSGAFLNVALFARNGDLVYSARPPVSRLYAAGTRPYFIEAVLQKRELLSQPFTSALTGTPVVVFALPLTDAHGQVEYVLAASLALAEAPMTAQAEGDGRLSYVMTSDGYLVSYPQRARLTHHVNEVPELNPEAALGLQGYQGWRLSDDASRVTAFARLRQAPWIVGLQAPENLVFAPLLKLREELLLAACILAALSILAAWLLSRFSVHVAGPASTAAVTPVPAPVTPGSQVIEKPTALPSPAPPGDTAVAQSPVRKPELDLDAFLQANFSGDEQRQAFVSTLSASVRKLPAEVAAVGDAMRTEPARATAILHTLKGAWGSLGARDFAESAAALETAIKTERPTSAMRTEFQEHAARLRTELESWLANHEAGPAMQPGTQPSADLLPLLRERNIGAATLYETSRPHWDKLLGQHAVKFAAAMDALDFETAERLLANAHAPTEETQRSQPVSPR
ncbi:Hpt domain-containing protein [Pseudoduganella sp. UC29_106]|uniref:Hpt domain-containing protein n=1 Tax=Pseudoduganella sp. UC29_106 TaxID=3374553 RepID=UPI003756C318